MVPGGAMGGALGGMVRQNWTFHFSCAAWSGNCRRRKGLFMHYLSNAKTIKWGLKGGRGGGSKCATTLHIKEVPHQFKLHDAHTISKDISGCTQQLSEGIQSVVFKGRTSNLEGRTAVDGLMINAGVCY